MTPFRKWIPPSRKNSLLDQSVWTLNRLPECFSVFSMRFFFFLYLWRCGILLGFGGDVIINMNNCSYFLQFVDLLFSG